MLPSCPIYSGRFPFSCIRALISLHSSTVSRHAREDLQGWVDSHDAVSGLHVDHAQLATDEQMARSWRCRVVSALQAAGEADKAQRLQLSGHAGYPDQDILPHFALCLGGQVVLQTGAVQEVFGAGPLVAHLLYCTTTDAAGHSSGHFAIMQSWLSTSGSRKRRRVGEEAPSQPPHTAQPSQTPEAFLADLGQAVGGFGCRRARKDVEVDGDDVIQRIRSCRALVTDAILDAEPGVVKIGVVLLLTHRLRLLDMSTKEHVEIIYSIVGDESLRSHNGTLYLYANGAWQPFNGVFPVAIMSKVRLVLARVEGLVRLFRDVPRTTDGVLEAMTSLLSSVGTAAQWYTRLEDAVIQPQGQDGDNGGWTRTLATAISRCSASLQELLAARKCVPLT